MLPLRGRDYPEVAALAETLAEFEETRSPTHLDVALLEEFIAARMDEIFALSISGADDDRNPSQISRTALRLRMKAPAMSNATAHIPR